MDKDIKILLERFMNGETSIEDESRLAEYFRSYDAENEEGKAYKEMFSWFDAGMPLEENKVEKSKPKRKAIMAYISLAAAAIAAFMVIVFRNGNNNVEPEVPMQHIIVKSENKRTITDTLVADTIKMSEPKQSKKNKNTMRKYRYEVAPPKTYIAENEEKDSINKIGTILAEKKLKEIEQQQKEKMEDIEENFIFQDFKINLMLAILESGEEEAPME
ncbi:MAG: hypothetical protein Q4D41_02360 [Prevotellaceae bacterium]|nr:hypothetical protein [Prevotellaceae bacterium]